MQRETNRFVIDRQSNVVWVDFSREPDPPAPRFPGAGGLREMSNIDPGQCNFFNSGFDNKYAT
jgi:hypothetical protein